MNTKNNAALGECTLGAFFRCVTQRFICKCDQHPKAVAAARRALMLLIALCVISLDPLGLGEGSDLRSRDTWYRIVSPFYPKPASEQISIVLLDDDTIASGEMKYPPSFAQYAELLKAVAGYKPKAVFFDFLFLDERGTPDERQLFERYIARATRSGTPVFLASPRGVTNALPPPGAPVRQDPQACRNRAVNLLGGFEQAAAGTPFVQSDERPNEGFYNLYGYEPCAGAIVPSPAMAMYRVGCLEADGTCPGIFPRTLRLLNFSDQPSHEELRAAFSPPMSVRWGDGSSVLNQRLYPMRMDGRPASREEGDAAKSCGKAPRGYWAKLARATGFFFGGLFQALQTDPGDQPCLYHSHIPAWAVFKRQDMLDNGKTLDPAERARIEDEQRTLFADKYVFIGGDLKGLPDVVPSPTHGKIPGVAFHAMALDNLLSFGNRYTREAQPFFLELDVNGLVEICLVIVFMIGEVLFLSRKDDRASASAAREPDGRRQGGGGAVEEQLRPFRRFGWAAFWLAVITAVVVLVEFIFFNATRYEPLNWLWVVVELSLFWVLLSRELLGDVTAHIKTSVQEREQTT